MSKDIPRRILLCDDDDDEALFLEAAFEKAGFQVELEWFNSCSRLLDNLPARGNVPDLIFIDLNMPGENGLECLSTIKEFPKYKNVPVIMYTTSTLRRDIEQAYTSGASLYVPKTNCEDELIDIVNHVLTCDLKDLVSPRKERFCYLPKRRSR